VNAKTIGVTEVACCGTSRRGRGRHEAEQFHVRFCFPHATAADAFRDRFGGERLTYTPRKPRPRALKLKSKRIYAPRIVTDHIMLQEDFERGMSRPSAFARRHDQAAVWYCK
jgi:hypothetical protein